MKKVFIAFGIMVMLIITPFYATEVQAQIAGVNDTMKTPSRLSLWFGKIKANCEKAMQWVSSSKMGKLVGDGIKAAKDGIKFAQEQYEAAMEFYNDNKNAVLNSNEYKAAQISKQMATASKELKDIESEKKEKIEELEQQVSVIEEKYAQKIASAQENLSKLQNSGDYTDTELESAQRTIENLQIQQEQELKSLDNSKGNVEDSYNKKLKDQGEKVVTLSNRMLELYSDEQISLSVPTEALENAKNEIFLQAGEKVTIASNNDMKEKRYSNRRQAIYDVYEKALRTQASLPKLIDEVNANKNLAKVTPGESETSGVHTKVMTQEIELLYKYAEMVVNDLILESTVAAAKLTPKEVNKKYSKFKLCDYSEYGSKDTNLMGQINAAKSTVSDLKDKADKVISTYNDVKDKVGTIKNEATAAIDAVNELKDTGEALKSTISNPEMLEGMI